MRFLNYVPYFGNSYSFSSIMPEQYTDAVVGKTIHGGLVYVDQNDPLGDCPQSDHSGNVDSELFSGVDRQKSA